MNFFNVDILTPDKVLAKKIPCETLIIPTSSGQMNVLPEHTHIISELNNGHLFLFGGADDPTRSFHVTGGIVKVLKDTIVVLTTAAEEDFDIDGERAKLALENAIEKLKEGKLDHDEFEKYLRKIERAKLRIQLVEESKKK